MLEVALYDVLGLDNSIARNRLLVAAVLAGTKLLEAEEQASFRFEGEGE